MKYNSKEILKRLKIELGLKTDEELANYLGIAKPTINTWKTRNSLDIKLIMEKCEELDIGYVLTGKEAAKSSEPAGYSREQWRELERLKGEIEKLKHELAKRDGQIELLKSMLREAERAKGGGVATFKTADSPKLKAKNEAD